MLDIKFLRQNIDFVRKKMLERGQEINLEAFAALDEKRRKSSRKWKPCGTSGIPPPRR